MLFRLSWMNLTGLHRALTSTTSNIFKAPVYSIKTACRTVEHLRKTEAAFELLSQSRFCPLLDNYFCHVSSLKFSATLRMPSRRNCLKMCTAVLIFKWLSHLQSSITRPSWWTEWWQRVRSYCLTSVTDLMRLAEWEQIHPKSGGNLKPEEWRLLQKQIIVGLTITSACNICVSTYFWPYRVCVNNYTVYHIWFFFSYFFTLFTVRVLVKLFSS